MNFPQYLQDLIESEKHSLISLAKISGIDKSDLSKVVRGRRSCGSKTLAQILPALTSNQQVIALQYWLRDQIPPKFSDLVKVVSSAANMVMKGEPDIRTFAGSLAILEKQSAINAHLRLTLMSMAQAFSSQ